MIITTEAAIQSLGLIGVIWGLIYTSRQIKHAAQVHNDALDWNRKTYTEDKLEKKPDIEMILKLEKAFNTKNSLKPVPLQLILEAIESTPELRLHVRYKLNRYERFARGIRYGVIDEVIIRNALGVHMVKDFLNYSEYIHHLQTSEPVGGLEEFTSLIKKWRKNGDFRLLFGWNTEATR